MIISKKVILLICMAWSIKTHLYSQDLKSPYFNNQTLDNHDDLLMPVNGAGAVKWYNNTANLSGYTGEYEIILHDNWFFWNDYKHGAVPPPQTVFISYDMEIVSFPFTPDCYLNPAGCAGQPNRNFIMPTNATPYSNNKWGPNIYRNKPISLLGPEHQALASLYYKDNFPLIAPPSFPGGFRYVFPHTIIKHTVYVHCEDYPSWTSPTTPSTPWVAKISWLYDNTRGQMKNYPFCTSNSSVNCGMSNYDVAFYPRILHQDDHQYNESNPSAVAVSPGAINYYPFTEINQNLICSKSILSPPSNTDFFHSSSSGYNKLYLPPYALVSAPLYQFRGKAVAGYVNALGGLDGESHIIYGMPHTYNIQQGIDLVATEISNEDRIIYNPSQVNIYAPDMVFPSHYSFRTIRGKFPSPAEVAADDIPVYGGGGPNSDPRTVPVRTDLRCEYPNYPNDEYNPLDSRYASLYHLKPSSFLTIAPCVSVFDAAFILEPGATLKYDNFNTQIGFHPDENISRVAIDRNGGRLIRQYDNTLLNSTLFLQNLTETAMAPNSYIVDEKIEAGENVDPTQQSGPYIAAAGTHLELIAKNYVKMDKGFRAEAGAEVKIAVDPYMSIPACPPPPPAASAGSRIRNAQQEQEAANFSKVLLSPNPAQEQTLVALTDKDDQIIRLQLHDLKGQLIQTQENILQPSWLLNISHLTDGLYLLSVTTKHQTQVVKLAVNMNK